MRGTKRSDLSCPILLIRELGPVHTYPDKFENAKIFIRFQRVPRPHVIVSESFLASTRKRFQIYTFSVGENAGYVWTKPLSVEIFLRFQIYPDTCGRSFREFTMETSMNTFINNSIFTRRQRRETSYIPLSILERRNSLYCYVIYIIFTAS